MSLRKHGAVVIATILLSAAVAHAASEHPNVAVMAATEAERAAPSVHAYREVFSAAGFPTRFVTPRERVRAPDEILVVPAVAAARLDPRRRADLVAWTLCGGRIVIAGENALARDLGLRFSGEHRLVAEIQDASAPDVRIRWRTPVPVALSTPPAGAIVHARAPSGEPLVASFARGQGVVLFLGVDLDDENPLGYGRLPFFLDTVQQTLRARPLLSARRLAAYCDLADHAGADLDARAHAWYEHGLREIHLSAWYDDEESARRCARLIAACHRHGLRVLAWLELPHVSQSFWDAHPQWREQTAAQTDAHVDWRSLMALDDAACFAAVARYLQDKVARFDWDGVDLAEVYYESPLGFESPERFTPMSTAVRGLFARQAGFDPLELFDPASPRYFRRNEPAAQAWLEFRRDRIVALHDSLLAVLNEARQGRPGIEIVVTLIDSLYDRNMRDSIATDAARVTALLPRHRARLQVEDPFTLWGLGPERYEKIGRDYASLLPQDAPLAVDINVVTRNDAIFPTERQTGLELLQLVARARRFFPLVCLYSEATVAARDWAWLARALATLARVEARGATYVQVASPDGVEVTVGDDARGVRVNGRIWPARDGGRILLPPGRQRVSWRTRGTEPHGQRLLDINATLLDAREGKDGLFVRYRSAARAYLSVRERPAIITLDGKHIRPEVLASDHGFVVIAPP
ncbi:MAG: hypothetical protein MUF51_08620, partial [Vicinamibacteria bacterium]|nr:hypothetical protein [Vicinamibacteria bacterium]